MICLEEEVGYPVQELATSGAIIQRTLTSPENIWRDRVWFLMCLRCFLKLVTIGAPSPSAFDSEDDYEEEENQNTLAWVNLDLNTPFTNEEETAFWGIYREQKLDDFLQELSNMLPTNTSGVVDFNVLGASFWNDQNFWANLEQQWKDEFSELELTEFHSDIDYSS